MGEVSNILHLPARVILTPDQDIDLEKINRHTLDPVSAEDVFTFSGNCSNDRMDAYFTRMDPTTTLRNYADDLKNGVSLQEGHNIHVNPYGRSYDGEVITTGDESGISSSVRGSWYIMRGLTVNGNKTDDTIRQIRAGIIRDMSVGFGGGSYRCGSCGKDLWDSDCPHIPGLEDEHSRMSFAWIVDARLREVSTVYKGATPGAYIDKARQYAQQGELALDKVHRLEQRFNVRLDNGSRSFLIKQKEVGANMNLLEQLRSDLKENKIEKRAVFEVLATEGETFRQPDDIAIRNELGDAATPEGVKQLKTEAEQGRQYLADLVDKAVESRVRAQGEGFKSEPYKNMLIRSADIEFIKGEIESYDGMTKQRFTPGRQSEPDNVGGRHIDENGEKIYVSEAYKGGNE
ncbi:hypothetical protein [Planomicrobium sp. CPCC 101079]|uniref:hypothetical protein n=1 Tax=Planomicrobium sp. CPCC 101079 TaxID=2599618 RepID=UPI0011B7954D|nr:hypothetical protein [Planomicrobium sp. CPCC 101079]TWT04612.1 hypothetical protein FQV28_08390 [Planomicrobium sp. CPCC 101079]